MSEMSIYDAKTHLSRVVALAEAGEETVITKHGRPVARVVPLHPRAARRTPGALRGQITMSEDFDDLDAQDLADWYGA
ncbi:type II toxin-antitoxin system Phd/YefM family antitoxin [Cellulomonas sp. SLBN-39]|uniref:type II toxin-antitoxin system Phd/YefM family antitoxin n=1 Tax=Cellulomonas sp. SLBN-39 TaxID=2768446 RepID=UPI0011703A70|nr:type II toxin-antitoxin system Phd/YefM family antitoxin [Cellulomonas sp. SLBN-39]TQL02025.1 prevent-host-death family protein [Cellulomonas sp. SLBN-39]